jgi:hypothetical protein
MPQKQAKKPGTGKGHKAGERKTRYTDADRVAFLTLLDANGGNLTKTAELTDVPYQTLQQWASGSRHPEARIIQLKHKGDLLAAAREALWQALDVQTNPDKLQRAPLSQVVQATNAAFSIVRTLEGHGPAHAGETVTVPIDLRKLTDDELRLFLSLCDKLGEPERGETGFGTGIGSQVLPPLRPRVLPADEPGPGDGPGRGDGRDSRPPASGP